MHSFKQKESLEERMTFKLLEMGKHMEILSSLIFVSI